MLAHGDGGRIINIASIAGKQGAARFAAYCSSKFGVIGFTQSLAQELAGQGGTVNAVCPSLTTTERVGALSQPGTPPDEATNDLLSSYLARTPIARLAQPRDIARTVTFLASNEADFLTGLAIPVAGGTIVAPLYLRMR